MVALNIEIFGEAAFSRRMLRFRDAVLDARPAFEAIADEFYASEKEQFDTEGHWASGGWPALAESTVAEKARHPEWDQRILHRTNTLLGSLTEPDAEGSVRQIHATEMFIGSSVFYGVFHQQPTPGSGRLPMRKPVELPPDVKVSMVKTMQAYLVGATRSATSAGSQPRDVLGRFVKMS